MADVWTCNDCESRTTTRRIDETSAADKVKHYVTVPYACSNRQCANSNPRELSANWCTAA
ncbi:hypothetical protein NCCP2145_38710 [Pseudarthrobacter sp. NCCP-2145]|nr:hypothetical protein NCCP2145_38710 [Pseudarthrobacter sp. NCCP-2145]